MITFDALSTGMIVYLFVIGGFLGAVFGSFITCQADRIIGGEDWKKGRSHCDACGHVLSIGDLVPIFSYLFHHGKCSYCGAKLSKKYLITEILMACAFMGIMWHAWALTWQIPLEWGMTCALLGLSLVDLAKYEIPDGYLIFGAVWWLLGMGVEALLGVNTLPQIKNGAIGAVCLGGGILVISLIMDKVLKKESMGGGDIKLLFVAGLYLGALNGLFSLMLACFIGLVFVLVLKKDKIPFGPSISIAVYLGFTIIPYIVAWYTGLLR
ncbi:MAG: prepilin peptidase [Solobacterium sp.]|jgi:leader peptidase (prepilin peptidase)/N-methyltransferase|nr:prepilin peptidase [Solobacterium sp.]MCH4204852.1 prepilin peptidase [Solobacterium sp.]MCH4226476.1 prepilin peptidase [Solobacterium sp.]MCH4283040.1 prepilin peptidase [Solobacterium sp.]